ncbi:MAG: flagellar M-ring protein FliF, partial [Ilumatobacteraceae bacterium]|nr:flagellar M-ring protein FliF [Ilumatobacteraceae bacterium]
MATDFRSVLGRAKEIAARLTPVQKIALGAIVLTAIAGTLVLGRSSGSTAMSPLYTNLQSSDTSAVVDALAAKNVEYSLTDAGHTVLVPTAQVYDLRVALAGSGLPSSSQGYSLLDKQGITTSDYRQRIDYQRALEGELDKTLEAMNGIQSAAVHLALPDESVFVDTPTSPTASVLLVSSSIDGIDPDSVDAVVHLVASSVKNLKPADVTVIDSSGAVLSTSGIDGQAASGASGRTKAVTAFEQRMQSALTTLLARTTGVGRVAVTVTADLDLNAVQSTSEDYGPIGSDPGTYVVSEQDSNEVYSGADNSATGVLGPDGATTTATSLPATTDTTTPTSTTIPGAPTTTVAAGATGTTVPSATATTAAGYGSSSGSRTYAIDRVVQQVTTAPGKILQLHVAVLVDDKAVTAAQATAIESLVTTAAGIDSTRGDSLIVSRLPFDTSAQTEAADLAKSATAASAAAEKNQMIRTVAIAFVILIALLLAYRSARRARRLTTTPINIGEIGVGRRLGAATELPSGDGDVPTLVVGVDRHEETIGEIANIADRRPEDVANVL